MIFFVFHLLFIYIFFFYTRGCKLLFCIVWKIDIFCRTYLHCICIVLLVEPFIPNKNCVFTVMWVIICVFLWYYEPEC